jgi:hypothetical protein
MEIIICILSFTIGFVVALYLEAKKEENDIDTLVYEHDCVMETTANVLNEIRELNPGIDFKF